MEGSPVDEIRARIEAQGRITFAEFMEVALYHPAGGYYARATSAHPYADYFTSPGAHPAFGALICVLLWRMWKALGRPSPFYAVEMGAGTGLLAEDAMEFAPGLSDEFAAALRYVVVDRAAARLPPPDSLDGLQPVACAATPFRDVVGCFLSNELLDSFPVHRFRVRDGELKEVYLTLDDDNIVEVLAEPSMPALLDRIGGLHVGLPEGYEGEVNLGIGPWTKGVSLALRTGFVLMIDYGHTASELYSPTRSKGTLRTHFRNTTSASPYQRIGQQDITAHVDFTSVVAEGVKAGLKPLGLWPQATLLGRLGLSGWLHKLRDEGISQSERDANSMAMRQLLQPDGLGGFKVLVQQKGTKVTNLDELIPDREAAAEVDASPVPLLSSEHAPLMEGRYPHAAWQPVYLWPEPEN